MHTTNRSTSRSRKVPAGGWRRVIDTGLESPLDFVESGEEVLIGFATIPRPGPIGCGPHGRASGGREYRRGRQIARSVLSCLQLDWISSTGELITMTIGYDKPLYILPFDHRGTFQKNMFGWTGTLTDEQAARSPP